MDLLAISGHHVDAGIDIGRSDVTKRNKRDQLSGQAPRNIFDSNRMGNECS